jgi:protein-tyrosine phosphatase
VNFASVPVPPDAPSQFAGVQRVTLCAVLLLSIHVTVPPTGIVVFAGTKQKVAQLADTVTIASLLSSCAPARARPTGASGVRFLVGVVVVVVVGAVDVVEVEVVVEVVVTTVVVVGAVSSAHAVAPGDSVTRTPIKAMAAIAGRSTASHTVAGGDSFMRIRNLCTPCSDVGKLDVAFASYGSDVKLEPQSRPRRITLERAFNFRDLGGYVGRGGRTVRWGRLYRADGIHRIEGADLARVAALGIRTVLDLRTVGELDDHGRVATESIDAAYHHLPLLERVWERELPGEELDAVDYLAARYLEMLELGSGSIITALEAMSTPDRLPLVFHCSAGKDRTGVLAAVLLSVVGVSDDDIAADYALSRTAMRELAEWVRTERPESYETMAAQPPAFLAAPPLAMQRFLALARGQYGSLTDYVRASGADDAVVDALSSTLLAERADS